MKYFVHKTSVVREIWGKSDTILFIFAAAAAEFSLNKAVDWLYYTGKLPNDPLDRLFSTVNYAKCIVFAEEKNALQAIEQMNNIHHKIEENRGTNIPDWAYRDVLFMLIDYSIKAFELLERKLFITEKEEVFKVFHAVGMHMNIHGLPHTFKTWEAMRDKQLYKNFEYSVYTQDLYGQYLKHLGYLRYALMREAQTLLLPQPLRKQLGLKKFSWLYFILPIYKLMKFFHIDFITKELLLPKKYKKEIKSLDHLT